MIEDAKERLHAYRKLVESEAWKDLMGLKDEALEFNRAQTESRPASLDNSFLDTYDKGVRQGFRYLASLPELIILSIEEELEDGGSSSED